MMKMVSKTDQALAHYGVLGMKWGVRRTPAQLRSNSSDSSVTKKVKADYNNMDDKAFMKKYQTTKATYAKRVEKYGDPYMNSPLAKIGKKFIEKEGNKKFFNKKNTKEEEVKKFIEKRVAEYKKETGKDVDYSIERGKDGATYAKIGPDTFKIYGKR